MLTAGIILTSCNSRKQEGPKAGKKPVISLVVWDEIAREGSDKAELRLFKTGANVNGLNVKYAVSGTAENGYDFRITENIIMDNRQVSLPIKPIDDTSLEGDETVIITLLPDSAYSIDTNNVSKTIYIRDNELPDVQFSLPCSSGPESRKPGIEVILSRPFTGNVEVEYNVSGILAQNSGDDYKVISGKLIIPAGTVKMSLPLSVIDDNLSEDDETLIIEIVKATNANIGLNEKHFYTIINDDGDVPRSSIYDKIYGIILGSRGGSSLGAVVENMTMEDIEKLYGRFNEFLPYNHYEVNWSHPAGATEDGIERQKLMCTAIIEKQDRISAKDLIKVWMRDLEIEDMYYMTQPYDKTMLGYVKWGIPLEELPNTRFGMPSDLGEHIHLTARVFHPIPAINAGDPEGAIDDMNEICRIFYENKNDDAFAWGGVYNAAICLAMLPGASVNSVIEGAMKYAKPEIKAEIEHGLAIAGKYSDPFDRRFREEINAMYADPESPYYVNKRITKYIGSSIYENVTCAFAILKLTNGNVEQAVTIANTRGRDTDCTAASAGALSGALTGTATIPEEWIDQLESGTINNPYTNSHMTNKATAQALYRALQNKLRRMTKEMEAVDKQYGTQLPVEITGRKKYLTLMHEAGVI